MDKQAVLKQLNTRLKIVDDCIEDNRIRLRSSVGVRAEDLSYLIHGYEGEREGLRTAINIVRSQGGDKD